MLLRMCTFETRLTRQCFFVKSVDDPRVITGFQIDSEIPNHTCLETKHY